MKPIEKLRIWVQNVLPVVYDDSLSYYEVLAKVVSYINQLIDNNSDIVDELDAQETDIEWLKEWVHNFEQGIIENVTKNKTFSLDNAVFIGDSFLQGYTAAGHVKSWGEWLTDLASRFNPDVVHRTYAEGGTGFVAVGQQGHTFETLLISSTVGLSQEEREKVETLICIGGMNDTLTANNITIQSFVNTAKTIFPNATIVIGYNPVVAGYNANYNSVLRENYADPKVFILNESSYWLYGNNVYNSGDNLHPSDVGQECIGYSLWSVQKGFTPSYAGSETVHYAVENSHDIYINFTKANAMLNLFIKGTANMPSGTKNLLLTDTPPVFMRSPDGHGLPAEISIPVYTDKGVATLFFANNGLYLICPETNSPSFMITTKVSLHALALD